MAGGGDIVVSNCQLQEANPALPHARPYPHQTARRLTFYSPLAASDYPLMGSFQNFYRNFGEAQWSLAFDRMRQISRNTIVVVSVRALKPDSSDPNGGPA